MNKIIASFCLNFLAITAGFAAPVVKTVAYKLDGAEYQGKLVYDDASKAPRPGLLMVPNWYGVTPLAIEKAKQLAGVEYVVFIADMYGANVRPTDDAAATGAVKPLYADREKMRARVNAAYTEFKSQAKNVPLDTAMLAAVGFCFGGSAVLDLGRSGADVAAIVTFHGNLSTDKPELAKNIKAKVLVLNGAEDKSVAPQVEGFEKEMRNAGVDWQFVNFGGAVHCFTETDAKQPGSCLYNPQAAARAYVMMRELLKEVFMAK